MSLIEKLNLNNDDLRNVFRHLTAKVVQWGHRLERCVLRQSSFKRRHKNIQGSTSRYDFGLF